MQLNHLALLFIAHSIIFSADTSCKKGALPIFHNDAEITGIDKSLRPCNAADLCNCPGGYFIHIDGVPDPQGKCISCHYFKTLQFPTGFSLGDDPIFPIPITMEWQYDTPNCDSSRITMITVKRR